MNLTQKREKGFALIFVLLIAAAMMIPVLMLLSSTAPRRTSVSGEAVSDRMLSLVDATVDKILAQINTFPSLVSTDTTVQHGFGNIASWYSDHPVSGETPAYKTVNTVVSKYAITYLLATLNGGTAYQPSSTADPQTPLQAYTDSNTYPSGGVTDGSGSLWDIEDNVSTYLYDLTNQEFYAVWSGSGSGTKIASVSHVGIAGDILAPSPIRNLSTGEIRTGGIAAWDSTYATDNRWIEVDTNTQYEDDGTLGQQSTKFEIRVSAYPVTSSGTQYVARNILAEATLKPLQIVVSTGGASGPYDKALWSGAKLTLNGNTTVAAADNLADALSGRYLTGADDNKGNIYADGEIDAKAGSIIIGGILYTSLPQSSDPKKDPMSLNQTPSVGGTAYGKQESLPDFPTGEEANVEAAAEAAGTYYYPGYSASNTTLAVSDGNWYINGNMTLDGTTINFGSDPNSPGTIWVNGNITFKSETTIQGQGKIVANGSITFQGNNNSLKYADADPTSMVAVVALGADSKGVSIDMQGNQDFMGLFYAPNGNIVKGGTGTVFGSLIAGGSVSSEAGALTLNGGNVIVYDRRWSDSVIMPAGAGALTVESVKFTGSAIYRFSWREVISKPVTQTNIQGLNPNFVFIP